MADYATTWHNQIFSDMTAIALVYTKAGLIIAADGRSLLERDPTHGTETQQKVFRGKIGAAEIVWAIAGSVRVGKFSLVDEVMESMEHANAIDPQPLGCSPWLDSFAAHLRKSVSKARDDRLIAPFTKNVSNPFATIFMAGYFCNRRPSSVQMYLPHENGALLDPLPYKLVAASFSERDHNVYHGSEEIIYRWNGLREDRRFLKYFQPSGPTLDEGLAHAKGCIEAQRDPFALEVDPVICKGIGGHIHAACVTSSGFQWLIEPLEYLMR